VAVVRRGIPSGIPDFLGGGDLSRTGYRFRAPLLL
jgi:hypothetical protein